MIPEPRRRPVLYGYPAHGSAGVLFFRLAKSERGIRWSTGYLLFAVKSRLIKSHYSKFSLITYVCCTLEFDIVWRGRKSSSKWLIDLVYGDMIRQTVLIYQGCSGI